MATGRDFWDKFWDNPVWDAIDKSMAPCAFVLGLVAILAAALAAMFPVCHNGFYYENGACNCDATIWSPQCAFDKCKFGVADKNQCICYEKYSGTLCDECNAQFAVGQCLGPCNVTQDTLYYGTQCQYKCDRNMPHGTCTAEGPVCDDNYSGPKCDVTCETPCQDGKTCVNGKCECKAGYYGQDCSLTCGQPPCNNRGTCTHGVCDCRAMFKGDQCQTTCRGDVTPCNGHGTCQEDGSCVCNEGWGARSDCSCNDDTTCHGKGTCTPDGCDCQHGYILDCDACDTNFADVDGTCVECVGCQNGMCKNVDGVATCVCKDNFSGANCTECADNYYPDGTCDTLCDFCGPHGQCTPDGKACQCSDNFAQPHCKTCKDEYYPKYGPNMCTHICNCNNEGTCDDMGRCLCNPGVRGQNCEHDCPKVDGKTCAGHGACVHDPLAPHNATNCACDKGWFGETCAHFAPKFNGHTCGNNGVVNIEPNGTPCEQDAECAEGMFCHADPVPFNNIAATCSSQLCNTFLESVDWHAACVRLILYENACNCSINCQDYPASCGYNAADDTTMCHKHGQEVTCVRDEACVFVNGTCRGRSCADVVAEPPPAKCANDDIYCSLLERVQGGQPLPVPPPAPVRDYDLYLRAARRRGTCEAWPLPRADVGPSASSLALHCYDDDTFAPLTSATVPRPDGCFVEQVDGPPLQPPPDFVVDQSIEADCMRAGPYYHNCDIARPAAGTLARRPYMRGWMGHTARISMGNVTVRMQNGYMFQVFVGGTSSSNGARYGNWSKFEVANDVLTVNGEVIGPVSAGDLTYDNVTRALAANNATCAGRHDQVFGPFDAKIFAGVDADLTELCNQPVSDCRLRNENINPIDVAFDSSTCAGPPYASDADWQECQDLLRPWRECGSGTCAQDIVGKTISCMDQCGGAAIVAKCNGNDGYPQELISDTCAECDATLRQEFTLERCQNFMQGTGQCSSAKCACDAGYSGAACEVMCPIGGAGETCGGNGRCVPTAAADDVPHEGQGISTKADALILGKCQCILGSGSACSIPCEKCDNGRYALGSSQKGICNAATGGCVALPPGMAYDLTLAQSESRANNTAAFTTDGLAMNISQFTVADVRAMLACDPVEHVSAPLDTTDTFALLTAVNADQVPPGEPAQYLVDIDHANITKPTDWSVAKGIPFDRNTSVSVFVGAYVWRDDSCQNDRTDLLRRAIQMQGAFGRQRDMEMLQCDAEDVGPTLPLGPTPVVTSGDAAAIFGVASDNVGHIIDIQHPFTGNLTIRVGDVTLPIVVGESTYTIGGGVATPFNSSARIFLDSSGAAAHKCVMDVFTPYRHELEMATLYEGKSGACGFHAEKTCPGATTSLNIPCSGHGVCDQPTCKCTCDVTPEESSRHGAQQIFEYGFDRSPFRGPDCATTCPGYDGYSMASVCSGNGHCNLHGKCECTEGFTGEMCEFKCPMVDGKVCNNHGVCYLANVDASDMSATNKAALDAVGTAVTSVTLTFDEALGASDDGHSPIVVETQCKEVGVGKYECAACTCDEQKVGFGKWAGPLCTVCDKTVWGAHCDKPCSTCPNGQCYYGKAGNGNCLCGMDDVLFDSSENKYFLREEREFTLKLTEVKAPSPAFHYGASCASCEDGFVGRNCMHAAESCLMGGTPLYEPNDKRNPPFTTCACSNIAFDADNNCCPVGFGVVADNVSQIDAYTSVYSVANIGDICSPCPGATDIQNPLTSAPAVCQGIARCDRGHGSTNTRDKMHCDCEEWLAIHGGQVNQPKCGPGEGYHVTQECVSGACVQCQPGYYNDVTDHQTACKACQPGYYMDGVGATQCTVCPMGRAESHSAATSVCAECPDGYVSQLTACLACDAGQYFADGQCEWCEPGRYQSERGQTSCDECPAGQFSVAEPNAHCYACGRGDYQDETGQGSCKTCPGGWQSKDNGDYIFTSCVE